MNNETVKLISPERVARLIECYGADSNKWPEDERAAAIALIQQSSDLQALQHDVKRLDDVLHGSKHRHQTVAANADLVSRIVNDLPTQEVGHAADFSENTDYLSGKNRQWGRVIAASVALFGIIALIMQLQISAPPASNANLAQTELERLLWEDVTGDSQNNGDEELTFMAMIELE